MFPKKKLDSTLVSETLRKIGQKPENETTKISDILSEFHENGLLLALLFFSLPVAIPLPYPPGFTTIMGMPLIILSIQMFLGKQQVSLPQKLHDYQIKNSVLKKISDKIVPVVEYIERHTKPRFSFAQSVYCEQFVGIVSFVSAIAIALPLPFTNAIPALGIAVMSLGLLNRDGVVIVIGFVINCIGCFIALAAITTSWIALKYVFNWIF